VSPAELLRAYVERHNEGVRTREFARLAALFAEDASMRFHGIAAGPFEGAAGILAAFAATPPDDEIVLLEQEGVEALYAWRRAPEQPAGRLRITVVRGRITAIDVTVETA
jgi:hypothetical protein